MEKQPNAPKTDRCGCWSWSCRSQQEKSATYREGRPHDKFGSSSTLELAKKCQEDAERAEFASSRVDKQPNAPESVLPQQQQLPPPQLQSQRASRRRKPAAAALSSTPAGLAPLDRCPLSESTGPVWSWLPSWPAGATVALAATLCAPFLSAACIAASTAARARVVRRDDFKYRIWSTVATTISSSTALLQSQIFVL